MKALDPVYASQAAEVSCQRIENSYLLRPMVNGCDKLYREMPPEQMR
jgi:hypothetical protein